MNKMIAVLMALAATAPALVSAQTNQRTQFNETLSVFNELVLEKKVGEALDMIQQDRIFSDEEKAAYNAELMEAYPDDFVGSATVQSATLKSGFRQELLAYWTDDGNYLFLYLLMHTRDNQRRVIFMDYSEDLSDLISLF